MLGSYLGKNILDGFFFNTDPKAKMNLGVTDVYLGLLTVLPQNNEESYSGSGYKFQEPDDKQYHRVQLNVESPFDKLKFIGGATEGTVVDDNGARAIPAVITNQCAIMFEESTSDWGNIVGFGIFKEYEGTNLPIIWGPITGTDGYPVVEVKKNEVPIIRVNGFKVSLV